MASIHIPPHDEEILAGLLDELTEQVQIEGEVLQAAFAWHEAVRLGDSFHQEHNLHVAVARYGDYLRRNPERDSRKVPK